jgi:murein DD-endopeptidase MepM/ murein hydrolase activator NlpD
MNTTNFSPNIGTFDRLESPTRGYWRVTSPFGFRRNPITGAGQEFHNGLDLAAPTGTDVLALFGGKVIYAGNKGNSLGAYVLISHSNEFQTLYAHLSKIDVKTGDMVSQYDKIGEVGSTGRSTGPHLHLGVYINSQKVDPMKLFEWRLQ